MRQALVSKSCHAFYHPDKPVILPIWLLTCLLGCLVCKIQQLFIKYVLIYGRKSRSPVAALDSGAGPDMPESLNTMAAICASPSQCRNNPCHGHMPLHLASFAPYLTQRSQSYHAQHLHGFDHYMMLLSQSCAHPQAEPGAAMSTRV